MVTGLPDTQPQHAATITALRRISIGLPANLGREERRFPLTPEAVKWLTESSGNEISLSIAVESGAANGIHYSDARYSRCGATIRDHASTLRSDIIITSGDLDQSDIPSINRGATWITLLAPDGIAGETLRAAIARHITIISLVRVTDDSGNCHIAETLAEVDGRAAIAVAAGLLADSKYGKGILLGGISGIVPCEVIVIGAGIAGVAAARSALGTGATVRVFDDDPSRLRHLSDSCYGAIIPSSLHREVFMRAASKADIIVNTLTDTQARKARLTADDISILKKEVIIVDTADSKTFTSLRRVDLSKASQTRLSDSERICFINTGNAVPRTASMAISNGLVPILEKIISARSVIDPIRLESGLNAGLVAVGGQVVNRQAAASAGLNFVDPSIYLHLS